MKKDESQHPSMLPEVDGQTETKDQGQGVPGMTVIVEFPSIKAKDLKPKFDADENGHLFVEIKFKAMIDNSFELFRIGNLMAQKDGVLFAMIGTRQAAMDFAFDMDEKQFEVITNNNLPLALEESTSSPESGEPPAAGESQGKSKGKAKDKEQTPAAGESQGKSKGKAKDKEQTPALELSTSSPEAGESQGDRIAVPESQIGGENLFSVPPLDETQIPEGYEQNGLLKVDNEIESPLSDKPDANILPGEHVAFVNEAGTVLARASNGILLPLAPDQFTWVVKPK